jgi:hypothetical protein
MSCNDLDRLRTQSPGSSSSDWPLEAQEHLASCQRCSQLQASLDHSPQEDFPEALQERIEAAILPALRPVSPLPGALRVTVMLLFCSLLVIAAANWRLGLAGWHARSRLQVSVNFSLLGISILALANALAQQMMPGSRRRASAWLYVAAPVLALLAADISVFSYGWNPNYLTPALSCWEIGVTCGLVSAPFFWLILRRGFSLNPVPPRRDRGTPGWTGRRSSAGALLPLSGSPAYFPSARWCRHHFRTPRCRSRWYPKQNSAPDNGTSSEPDLK